MSGAKVDVLAVLNRAEGNARTLAMTGDPTYREYLAELAKASAAVADLIDAQRQIKHSIQQARILGNDWKRELALIENTVDAALARVTGDTK